MKKTIKIASLLILLGTFNACSDAYNIVQEGELRETNAITSVGDMQLYLNGVYAFMGTEDEIAFTSIFTDECGTGRGSGGQNFDTHRFQINPSNSYAQSIWYGYYSTIDRCNRLLRAAQKIVVVPGSADELAYNHIIAQTKAIRAFSYFQLLCYYSPDIKNDSALGVILSTEVQPIDADLPRSSVGEICALIESDIISAEANLNPAPDPAPSVPAYYITKNMLNAFRARYFLYRGNYTLAAQYAQDAINNGPALVNGNPIPTVNPASNTQQPFNPSTGALNVGYWNVVGGTATANPYKRMFYDVNIGECIFAMSRPAQGSWSDIGSNFNTNSSTINGSPFFEVGRKLFNLLRTQPAGQFDVRLFTVLDASSKVDKNYATNPNYVDSDVLIIDKYPGKVTNGYPLRNDIKVFRTSEMYLILAECYAMNGNYNGTTNSTAAMLKALRDKRYAYGATAVAQPLPTYSTKEDALRDVLAERRLELCYEGHRLLDLKRLGPITGLSIDRDATDDEIPGQPLTLPITDHRFTLPIPFAELNANPNMVQNPGY